MTRILKAITRKSPGHYRIELEESNMNQTLSFDFEIKYVNVDSQEIEVLPSTDEFAVYVNGNVGAFPSLFKAILNFHFAQKLEYP
jgi:hypothetical protein